MNSLEDVAPDAASASVPPDPIAAGAHLAGAVAERGLAVKLTGGVGVALVCPSAHRAPFAREYKDVDIVSRSHETRDLTSLLEEIGWVANSRFNAIHGHARLMFGDPATRRQLDVFVDRAELCHTLEFHARLGGSSPSLPLADLLLMKLQVVETTPKDLNDAAAILHDHEVGPENAIDLAYLTGLTGSDWGLWRTTTMVIERLRVYVENLDGVDTSLIIRRLEVLSAALEDAPKSRSWRLRAKVGDRKQWYRLPEEVDG
jgi:hypothetical protein